MKAANGGDADAEAQVAELKAEVEAANAAADAASEKFDAAEAECDALFATLPNLLDDRVPDGDDDAANLVVDEWKTDARMLGDEGAYMWHDEIAASLDGWDPDGASAVAGARFAVLRGPVARLERALAQLFLDLHTCVPGPAGHGYVELSVPTIVSESALRGTGQLPKFADDLFAVSHLVNGEKAYMIPTAEVPLTNLRRGQMLAPGALPLAYVAHTPHGVGDEAEAPSPLRYVAHTPCFRAEAGSYGRDTRGLMRQHQFYKVELVRVCEPEAADANHEALTAHAEACLRALELPYRKVLLCSGDVGFSARLCYDLEVWLPGQQAYREVSSCSQCGDFQARRMGLRYRPAPEAPPEGEAAPKKKAPKPKPVFCHTLNGSGLAVGRALIAVLENYQRPDGTVEVPEALRPYMGGLTELKPPGQS